MNAEQQFFLITTICYIVSIVAMWQTPLFKPFKLLAVFFHEFSHAIGATICCNRVTGLEISWNEGGLCTYQGVNANSMRSKCCVLPAGYIGSVLWGCFIIICTGWSAGPRVMGIIIIIALTIALGYAVCGVAKEMESRLTVIATALVFIALVLSITILDFSGNWEHSGFLLESVILYIGCCNMVFGTYDIYDDTVSGNFRPPPRAAPTPPLLDPRRSSERASAASQVRRKDERSDAYKYAELAPCMFARCVGTKPRAEHGPPLAALGLLPRLAHLLLLLQAACGSSSASAAASAPLSRARCAAPRMRARALRTPWSRGAHALQVICYAMLLCYAMRCRSSRPTTAWAKRAATRAPAACPAGSWCPASWSWASRSASPPSRTSSSAAPPSAPPPSPRVARASRARPSPPWMHATRRPLLHVRPATPPAPLAPPGRVFA